MEPLQLYTMWRKRFVMRVKYFKKKESSREVDLQYDKEIWVLICKGVQSLIKSKAIVTINAVEAIASASGVASQMISTSFGLDNNPSTKEVLSPDLSKNGDALNIHTIAHKKLSSYKLKENELSYLSAYRSDGSPKSDLLFLSSKLLIKKDLLNVEEELLELSLSGIYNYINPYMKNIYETELDRPMPVSNNNNNNNDFVSDAISLGFETVNKIKNIDEALSYIQLEKSKLSQNRNRDTDEYIMLSILEKIIEDTELWRERNDEQEITSYMRFASLLDVLFKGTDIRLSDGETGSSSSRIAIETNKCVFNGEDLSPTYAQKIDLILRYDDTENVELSSNEWKKTKITNQLKLKQQSKNLRVNACILNNLNAKFCKFNETLALDLIGLHGYLYKLTKIEDYFVATPISSIIIPKVFMDLDSFKETLTGLFFFKSFFTTTVPKLRKRILEIEAGKAMGDVYTSKNNSSDEPFEQLIFFRTKRRKPSN
ncbi:hypothetical protein BDF21DRAFT_410937 [Thamnidium elegans]|nr:hypothetical protein BDF21DRAFT_410937 [Thamnidium elegans]